MYTDCLPICFPVTTTIAPTTTSAMVTTTSAMVTTETPDPTMASGTPEECLPELGVVVEVSLNATVNANPTVDADLCNNIIIENVTSYLFVPDDTIPNVPSPTPIGELMCHSIWLPDNKVDLVIYFSVIISNGTDPCIQHIDNKTTSDILEDQKIDLVELLSHFSIQSITGVTVATQHKVGAFCNGKQVVFRSHDEGESHLETRFVLCGM